MMSAPKASDIEDVKLPMVFIFTGLILFVAAQVILSFKISSLVNGIPESPTVLSAAHLILLGFGTMVAMGAMYQLIPVALQVKIRYRLLSYIHYIVYVIGVVGLAWSLFNFSTQLLVIFGTLTVIGVILFVSNMAASLRGADSGAIKMAVTLAITFLLLTVLLGLTLAIDFYHPFLGEWHTRLFHVHILFGTIGWFTLLVMGLSFKLAPMFTLSHKYESWYGPGAVHLIHIGIWVMTVGFLLVNSPLIFIGAIIIIGGFVCYGIQMQKVLKNRLKKKYDLGIRVSLFSLPFTSLLIILSILLGFILNGHIPVIAIVYLTITSWIALVILGYLFKIIPFLWWTYKYGERIGQKGVPTLKDMVNEKRGKWWMISFFSTITLITAALVTGFSPLAVVAQIVFLLTSVGYGLELANVLRK
jgi:hypothetical protein